jgi:FixJ family two-component response regulator
MISDRDKKRVLIRIVDDDEEIRTGLSFLLSTDGWRALAYKSAEEFLKDPQAGVPGCLILDIRMPGMSGIELQRVMKERGINLPIIIVTGHADVDTAVQTMKMGALDFLQKPVKSEALIASIEEAASISLEQMRGRLPAEDVRKTVAEFTPQERDIAKLLFEELSNRAIAERLSLSERTVQAHRNTLYHKLRVHSLGQYLEVMNGARDAL